MEKQIFLLVECTDYKEIYRTLLFNNNTPKKEIQNKIYEIKNNFYDNDFDGWTIDDILEQLSKYYNFEDLGGYEYLEV